MGGNALSGSTLGDGHGWRARVCLDSCAKLASDGTVTLNPNGTYSYTLNNDSAAVQALVEGATLTETFTYTYTSTVILYGLGDHHHHPPRTSPR